MKNMVKKNNFDKKNYEKLLNKGICYHFTALTFNNLIITKLKNRYYSSEHNTIEGNYKNINRNGDDNYKQIKNTYKTLIDNLLLKYIDKRDLDILRE